MGHHHQHKVNAHRHSMSCTAVPCRQTVSVQDASTQDTSAQGASTPSVMVSTRPHQPNTPGRQHPFGGRSASCLHTSPTTAHLHCHTRRECDKHSGWLAVLLSPAMAMAPGRSTHHRQSASQVLSAPPDSQATNSNSNNMPRCGIEPLTHPTCPCPDSAHQVPWQPRESISLRVLQKHHVLTAAISINQHTIVSTHLRRSVSQTRLSHHPMHHSVTRADRRSIRHPRA